MTRAGAGSDPADIITNPDIAHTAKTFGEMSEGINAAVRHLVTTGWRGTLFVRYRSDFASPDPIGPRNPPHLSYVYALICKRHEGAVCPAEPSDAWVVQHAKFAPDGGFAIPITETTALAYLRTVEGLTDEEAREVLRAPEGAGVASVGEGVEVEDLSNAPEGRSFPDMPAGRN